MFVKNIILIMIYLLTRFMESLQLTLIQITVRKLGKFNVLSLTI